MSVADRLKLIVEAKQQLVRPVQSVVVRPHAYVIALQGLGRDALEQGPFRNASMNVSAIFPLTQHGEDLINLILK